MSDAFQPIFRYFFERVKPGVSCGTSRFEISGRPFASVPVTAVIVVPPVRSVPEFVMKAFVPLMTQRPVAQLGARSRAAGIAARLRFRQAEAPQHFTARQRDEVPLLLLFRAEQIEWRRAERDVRGERDRGRCVGARDLHHGQRVADRIGARTAVLLGKRQAHEAELRPSV